MPSRPRRPALHGLHPGLEVGPPLFCDPDLGLGDCSRVLFGRRAGGRSGSGIVGTAPGTAHARSGIGVLSALRAPESCGKGKVRAGRSEHVQTIDLVVERYLALGVQAVDEIVDRLVPV